MENFIFCAVNLLEIQYCLYKFDLEIYLSSLNIPKLNADNIPKLLQFKTMLFYGFLDFL